MTIETMSAYGCVECQEWHYEGDAEYQQHIGFQSKHGIVSAPIPPREQIYRYAVGRE